MLEKRCFHSQRALCCVEPLEREIRREWSKRNAGCANWFNRRSEGVLGVLGGGSLLKQNYTRESLETLT